MSRVTGQGNCECALEPPVEVATWLEFGVAPTADPEPFATVDLCVLVQDP